MIPQVEIILEIKHRRCDIIIKEITARMENPEGVKLLN
jgi:hypothetical protein